MITEPNSETFRSYIFFWIGQIFSLLGSSVVAFIIPVWITGVYEDEVLTSLVYFVTFIPQLIVVPFAGVYSDRLNKKMLILFADSMQAIVTLILIIVFATGAADFVFILLIAFLRSTFQAIHFPPANAIIPLMVPEEKLSRINGLNYLFTSFINVIGPIVAGVLIFFFPIEIALWIDVITFFIALIPLLKIQIPDVREKGQNNKIETSFFEDMHEGFKTIKFIPGLLVLLLLATFANFLEQPLHSLLSNFILVNNSGTTIIYAIISGIISFGLFIGAIVVTVKKEWKRKMLIIVWGILVGNIGYFIISISPYQAYILMGIGGIIYGFFLPIVNTMFFTIVQSKVPKDKQGRVISIAVLVASGITPLSIIIAGPISKIIGISTLWFIFSLIGIGICLLLWFFSNLREIDQFEINNLKNKEIDQKII